MPDNRCTDCQAEPCECDEKEVLTVVITVEVEVAHRGDARLAAQLAVTNGEGSYEIEG